LQEISGFNPKLHFFICINDRRQTKSEKPSCGVYISKAMVKELKLWVRSQGWGQDIYITSTNCLGGCNKDGGVVACYPQAKFFKDFQTVDELKELIFSEMGSHLKE